MIIYMKLRGFTIVELLVVLSIMGILLVLSVASLRGSQVSARDSERKTDIETIAMHLEKYYNVGSDNTTETGRYPSTELWLHGAIPMLQTLRDIDPRSLVAPGIVDDGNGDLYDEIYESFVCASNNVQTTAGVRVFGDEIPSNTQYVYQPLKSDGTLCTSNHECRKFNLYYRLETDDTIYMITSKNQ